MVGAGVLGGTVNVGASYDHTKHESTGKIAFVDIDGDGLPDKVFQLSGSLYYCKNLGADKAVKAFSSPVKIEGIRGFSSSVSTSNSIHTNIGVDYGIASAGISYIHTSDQEKTKTYFNDFNGDGLPDRLSKADDDNLSVEINTGTDFSGGWSSGDGDIGKTRATSASVYGDFSVKIPIHVLFLKFTLTPIVKHSESSGVSTVHSSLQDIDGDGLPDLLYADGEDKIQSGATSPAARTCCTASHCPLVEKSTSTTRRPLRATTRPVGAG